MMTIPIKVLRAIIIWSLLSLTTLPVTAQEPVLDEIGLNAARAYIFGYPLVLMDETRKATVGDAFNRLNHLRSFPDHRFRRVVRANVDTLYSTIWFDLSDGPIVVGLPASGGRYYVMPIHDAWTNVIASIGSRTTGNDAYTVLVAGPNWHGAVPEGMTLVRSPTKMAWAIARIDTPGGADFVAAHKFQDGMTVQSLASLQLGESAQPPLSAREAYSGYNPKTRVSDLGAGVFFNTLARLLEDNPPATADAAMVDGPLKLIGVEAGKPFPATAKTMSERVSMNEAVYRTQQAVLAVQNQVPKSATYWAGMPGGPRLGVYGTRYPLRAYVAMVGLGANEPEDAVYPNTTQDENGETLTTDRRYVLHLSADQIPPVNAFWSLTVYNQHYYLAENPIDRYALGSRDDLTFNEDGSVDIYIQTHEPEGVPLSNWLPAPQFGAFGLNMRLYWPKERVLDGDWNMPGVQVVD